MLVKRMNLLALLISGILILASGLNLEAANAKTIKIKTSTVQCGMCKKTIEDALEDVKGVVSASVNVDKKETAVKYNPSKTNPDKIRKAISNAGYAADKVKANKSAYNKLMKCCKLPQDR